MGERERVGESGEIAPREEAEEDVEVKKNGG